MRHRKKGRKLSRKKAHRNHLARNLATQIFTHGRIETTLPKAKFVKPLIDKIVTISKKDTLSAKRQIEDLLFSNKAVDNVLVKFQEDFKKRDSGYSRIIRLKQRLGDGGQMVILDLMISDDKKLQESKSDMESETPKKKKDKKEEDSKNSFWDRFKGDEQQKKTKKATKTKKTTKKESTQRTTSK